MTASKPASMDAEAALAVHEPEDESSPAVTRE
jgi:hypothetical protein